MDDGLIQGLVGFGGGFLKGMNDAEDRKYKRMEWEAKSKAAATEAQNKQFDNELNARGKGFLLPPKDQPIDVRSLKWDPEYVDMQTKIRTAGANADPFGQKTKPTEGEYLSGGFAHRMEQAEASLQKLTQSGFDPASDRASYQSLLGGKGLVGRATEGFKDQDVKLYEQAKENFISAVLRKESGAAISDPEYNREDRKYFPQRGDGPEAIAQKTALRAQALANLKAASGRAYERIPSVPAPRGAGSNGLIKATVKPEAAKGKIRVSNGSETLEIDAKDLKDAMKDGFKRVD